MKNSAIIVAGGLGHRMNSVLPKQFMLLCGKPVLQWSLECFSNTGSVEKIVLVLPEDWICDGKKYLSSFKTDKEFVITSGGKLRQDSVRNGLRAVGGDFDFVAVHDAARPGITPELVEKGFEMAFQKGNAVLAVPSYDTLAKVVDGEIVDNVDRNIIYRVQTPQIFSVKVLNEALDYALKENVIGTDEATLVRKLGYKVFMLEGSERVAKITTAEDLKKAEFLIGKRERI